MSFISVEPQSRVLLESHTNSLLAQFDTQLRILADRYLAFFRERRRIEATYINSLRKLYRKAKTVDASIDRRGEPTTTRTAWDNERDNLGRDADVQQAFMDILANDVIKPLEMLKTRNLIKENLEQSAENYAYHAKHSVSKLQQAYLRKYQPQQDAPSANVSQHPQDVPNKRFGGKVSGLFRGLREDSRAPEPPSEECNVVVIHGFQLGLLSQTSVLVSEDDCRDAVIDLNKLRWVRAESLRDGYDCLEELVFTPTVKNVLVKYMDSVIKACAKRGDIEKSTWAEVENALGGTDTSDMRASFRRALSLSTPPLTLYHNHHFGKYSNLIFGVPLVDQVTNEDNVPKVMRMCINEVEKRGLNIDYIYSLCNSESPWELQRKFESEKPFSFTSTDNIQSVAALLKIRELHPVHRASLDALLRHLLHVASHSDNRMTVEELSSIFRRSIFGYDALIPLEVLVLRDLIQNVHTLFDKRPSQSPPVPSSIVAETMSTNTYSSLYLSPELPESTEVQAAGSPSRHRPGLVDGTPVSTQSSFSSFPSGGPAVSRLTPPPIHFLSHLL
ncbi:hypothetical protein V8E53_002216 [Lactarius tabidus]